MKPSHIRILLTFWALMVVMDCAADTEQIFVKAKPNNKAKTWREYKTTLLENLTGFSPSSPELSQYGGRKDRKEKATGFFHTKKTDDGWVLVDPEGYHYFSIGVCSTSPNDEFPDHKKAFSETFKSPSDWAKKTHKLLVDDLNFNSLGCWSDWRVFLESRQKIPYVRRWNLMASYGKKKRITFKKYGHAGFPNDVIPVFDKGFAEHCDEVCQKMSETRNDPWLIGHFSDNELPLKSGNILKRYLQLPAKDANHLAAVDFLKEEGIKKDEITRKHDEEFAAKVIGTYYKTVHDSIRKHDPNHLILGSRLHGRASNQDICYTASGPFVDVVSINYYHRWTPNQAELDRRAKLAGKPILVTEWYAKGVDSKLNNSKGAGFTVLTQQDRGRFYENFTIGLLKNRNVVGWHWFRYIDDGDLKTEGYSCNKGIVDMQYKPYRELAESIKVINSAVYPLSDFLRGYPANLPNKKDEGANKTRKATPNGAPDG